MVCIDVMVIYMLCMLWLSIWCIEIVSIQQRIKVINDYKMALFLENVKRKVGTARK